MEAIYEILHALFSSPKEHDVLATIIQVEGSAYRKEGTSMLIRDDGTQIGLLSSNCLETDLSERVREMAEGEKSKIIVYDMRAEDDLSWGLGAGCNGKIHVLLEPIDTELRVHLWKLKFYLDTGYRVTMVKQLTNEPGVFDYLFIADDQKPFGKWKTGRVTQAGKMLTDVHQKKPDSGVHSYEGISGKIYIHSFQPKPRLILFGAGTDAIPVVRFAAQTGFRVIVSDWRSLFCDHDHFPEAEEFIIGFPHETVKNFKFIASDSVLIMSHQFQRDKELLKALKGKKISYLGVLGPRLRTERLLDGQEIPEKIHSPAGLSIGAEGPEEIAISIVAELIQCQKQALLTQDVYL